MTRHSSALVAALVLAMLLVCVLLPKGLHAGEQIRVAIADSVSSVTLKAHEGLRGEGVRAGQTRLAISPASLGTQPFRISSRGLYIQVNGKSYRGRIEIRKKRNGLLLVVNELDIEDYLKGVIAAEIPHDWQPEALKAQAIASRTYALYQKRTAGSRPYHILATVDSQVYSGRSGEHGAALAALRDTEGIVITYQGEIIPAYYHASCGGRTESAFDLWGIDAPYLQGVDCECQEISKYGVWEKRIGSDLVARALKKSGYQITGISNIAIDGITPAGRVKQVSIYHAGGLASIPAEKFRSAIGYAQVPSLFFEIELSGNEIVISGRGLGHGVGLCQWGAQEMALRGLDHRAILQHYYPGTRLAKRGALYPS